MAVVSQDHADESYNVENYSPPEASSSSSSSPKPAIRYFTPEEVERHNAEHARGDDGGSSDVAASYWAVVDGFVVDAVDFLRGGKHPGGRKKVLATNDADTGDVGRPYAFSFSRGRNAHFPETARAFRDGVARFLEGGSAEIAFPSSSGKKEGGKLVVLGRLRS